MDDLLKEAIADAKAVRETALENAKIALEEAFTPRLQSMLSKKIQSEIENEDEVEEDEEEAPEAEEAPEEGYHEDDEDPTDDHSDEAMHADDDEKEVEEAEHEAEEEMEEEGVIEINGVKYAPVVAEEEEEAEEKAEDEMEESDNLDLEAVLRELEEEEGDEDDEVEEAVKEEEDEEGEEVDEEVDNATGIGSSDNKAGSADKSSGIGTPGKAKHESVKVTEEEEDDDKEEVEEEIDLEEVIKALSEEEDEEEEKNEVNKLQSDLDEHRNVVKYLRTKLNEVNLLNAKLLFTNKLFRSFGLSNDQKMKVVENFDRAHNLREVKLVYSTLAESFGTKTTKTEIKEHKGSASKAVASTKSKKQEVIAEGSELRDRFKKLAGII
jgi:hypothetical protein